MLIGIDCRALGQNIDGIGKYTIRLVETLVKIDKQNEYVLFFNNRKYSDKEYGFNFKATFVPYRHLTLRSIMQMGALVNGFNLDIFHSLFFLLPFGVKCKTIVTVPDLMALKVDNFFSGRPKALEIYAKYYHKIFVPWSIKRADTITAISDATKLDINETINIPAERIKTTLLGVDDIFYKRGKTQLEEVTKKYSLPDNYIIYTGNTKPYKNLPGLLKSYKIYKDNGGKYDLVIIAYKDRFRNNVEKMAFELGIRSDILILDCIDNEDLPKIMSKAKIFIFISLYEGFGLPPLEAMACGCPTVVSNIPSLNEVVGDAAIKKDPNDYKGIADSLLSLEKNDNIRKFYSQIAIEQAKKFSWEKYARETLQIYESLR